MEVSSLLCLGAKGLAGSSGAGWPCGLQEPDASILMTWKPPEPLLHSWKGVLLACLPTVRTRTRKRKGTDVNTSVSETETGLHESIDSGLGLVKVGIEGSVELWQLLLKSSFSGVSRLLWTCPWFLPCSCLWMRGFVAQDGATLHPSN